MQWKWCDYQVKESTFLIPNSHYVSDGKIRLLSTKHWEKNQRDHKTHGSKKTILCTSYKLFWDKSKYSLHISFVKLDNVETLYLTYRYNKFHIFCQKAEKG